MNIFQKTAEERRKLADRNTIEANIFDYLGKTLGRSGANLSLIFNPTIYYDYVDEPNESARISFVAGQSDTGTISEACAKLFGKPADYDDHHGHGSTTIWNWKCPFWKIPTQIELNEEG